MASCSRPHFQVQDLWQIYFTDVHLHAFVELLLERTRFLKNLVFFTVGIMMQSAATKKGALWSLQVLFSIYIMSSFNYFAKFKSSLCVYYWNLKITILYHNVEWWNSPWILKTSYLKLEEESFKISREIFKEAH